MPSTGRGSIASTASENSFENNSEIVNENRHDSGERAETDGHYEHQREDNLVDGATGVHQAAGRLHDPLRADIARAQDREWNTEQNGKRCSPDCDLDSYDHVVEIMVPIVEIGLEKRGGELRHVAPVRE